MIKFTSLGIRSADYRSVRAASMLVFPITGACGIKGVSLCLDAGRASLRVSRILQRKMLSVSAKADGEHTLLSCPICINDEELAAVLSARMVCRADRQLVCTDKAPGAVGPYSQVIVCRFTISCRFPYAAAAPEVNSSSIWLLKWYRSDPDSAGNQACRDCVSFWPSAPSAWHEELSGRGHRGADRAGTEKSGSHPRSGWILVQPGPEDHCLAYRHRRLCQGQ